MKITWFEKTALFAAGAGAAGKVLVWSLGAQLDSLDPTIATLRVGFAWLSFVAFDLVIGAVVLRGWSRSGAAALAVSAAASALIALDVANNQHMAVLHAAPALTLAVFGAHLMLAGRSGTTPAPQSASTITQAVQVNVALPRTVAAYIAARAGELPQHTPAQLAAELGTSPDTVRRMLDRAATETTEQE